MDGLLGVGVGSGLLSRGTFRMIFVVGLRVCPASLCFGGLSVEKEDAEVVIKYREANSARVVDFCDRLILLNWAGRAILGVVLVFGITLLLGHLLFILLLLSRLLVIITICHLVIQRLIVLRGIRRYARRERVGVMIMIMMVMIVVHSMLVHLDAPT
jgi:hypothetical protein